MDVDVKEDVAVNNTISFPYAFFKGKIVPIEEAKVSIMTNALQYGTGVFGGIRGYLQDDKKTIAIFRLKDHYARLLKSMVILNKSIPYSHDDLVKLTLDLIKKNNPDTDCYVRPIAYADNLGLSPNLNASTFDFAMYVIPLGEYLPISKGLKMMISNWIRISDHSIPSRAKATGGYINSALARGDAEAHGYDDAILIDARGHITEASAANLFMVREGVLITPPKYSDVLEGITRRSIIEVAEDLGIKTEERDIDRTEIYTCDEAFLTGTGAQVAWISEIDKRKVGDGKMGPISERIQKTFFEIVRGKNKKYNSWLTAV